MKLMLTLGAAIILTLFPVRLTAFAADTLSIWAVEEAERAIAENLVPENLRSNYTQAITRAEFYALAVALYEAVEGEIIGRYTFTDSIDINVEKAAYLGITSGIGNNAFDPNGTLNREQAAVMLSGLIQASASKPFAPPFQMQLPFADSGDVSPWANGAVNQMNSIGIMGSVGNNMFEPHSLYTREQSISTLMRTLHFVKELEAVAASSTREMQYGPEQAPRLYVGLKSGESHVQEIMAIQLSTSWTAYDEEGRSIIGYMSDSAGPLQMAISEFLKATLELEGSGGEIELVFSDDYPPESLTAYRWNAVFATGRQDAYNNAIDEPVEIDGNTIHIKDDGYDYIYGILAEWPMGYLFNYSYGRSFYTFRIISSVD